MKEIIFLSVIFTFLSCFINNEEVLAYQHGSNSSSSRVIPAAEDTSIIYFPYMSSLRIFGAYYCVASIIGDDDLLAPASCFTHADNVIWPYAYVTVHVATSSSVLVGMLHQIAEVTVHPGWTGTAARVHDIAHIKVTVRIDFDRYRQKVNLPIQNAGNLWGWVTGWDFSSPYVESDPEQLQKIKMWTLGYSECQRLIGSYVQLQYEQLCVYQQRRRGRYKIGSGAPIVSNNYIIGMRSWTADGNSPDEGPEIFVNIFAEGDFLLPLL